MPAQRTTFLISDCFVTAARHRRTKTAWHLEQAVAMPVDAPRALVPETDLACYVNPMIQLAREIHAVGNASRLLIPGTWVFAHPITLTSRRFDPLAAGLHRQRSAINEAIDAIAHTERQLYTQSFPGRPVPPGIALRIASERIRLEGLTRSANPDSTRNALLPAQTVPEELRHLIAAIPTDVRLFVQDLQLDDHHLTLRGTARSHAEAERIASALRDAHGWVPSPPRSDVRRGGGVGFALHARRGTDEPNDQATPD